VPQTGEFSFILAGLGASLGVLPSQGRDLILAGSLLSITLNPLAFAGIPAILHLGFEHKQLRTKQSIGRRSPRRSRGVPDEIA